MHPKTARRGEHRGKMLSAAPRARVLVQNTNYRYSFGKGFGSINEDS